MSLYVVEAVLPSGRVLPRWDSRNATVEARTADRPWTETITLPDGARRISVKRCCNGCGALLGDLVDTDVSHAGHLTDIRRHCPICTPQTGKALAVIGGAA